MGVLANLIGEHVPLTKGLALYHGAAARAEHLLLRERIGADKLKVVATDTVEPPPGLGVVKWPAGRVKREWVGAADFVYSHELITAEAPLQLLGAWARCLRPAGVIAFEWCDGGGAADEGGAEAEGGAAAAEEEGGHAAFSLRGKKLKATLAAVEKAGYEAVAVKEAAGLPPAADGNGKERHCALVMVKPAARKEEAAAAA